MQNLIAGTHRVHLAMACVPPPPPLAVGVPGAARLPTSEVAKDARSTARSGECERRGDESSGIPVHTGARIGALAGAGEVLTSRTVRVLSADSRLVVESVGPQRLKGAPD